MLENAAIDVAIGLILMYLMLSLLCTVVNEYIATKLSLRAKSLASALIQLLDNDTLRTAFYSHGLIVGTKDTVTTGTQSVAIAVTQAVGATAQSVKGFLAPAPAADATPAQPAGGAAANAAPAQQAGGAAANAAPVHPITDAEVKEDHPSYLSAHTIALALIASLTPGTPMPGIVAVSDAVQKLPEHSKIRSLLLSCLTEAQGDFSKLQDSIATCFDDAMDRLSGAYKRQIKLISVLVGLVIAIAFNADSFRVATTLWKDPDRRAAAVQMAENAATNPPPASGKPVTDAELKAQVDKTETSLRSLPIGWSCPANPQTAASTTTPAEGMTLKEIAKQYWDCAREQKQKLIPTLRLTDL